jgi:hypothetical protein
MAAVVTFAQLPEEETDFLAYLLKSGEVWARAVNDDPSAPRYEPARVAEFLDRFASRIVAYHNVAVYLGPRPDILEAVLGSFEVIEGGTTVPFVQFGEVVPGAHTIVGGTKVRRPCVDFMASCLIGYDRGVFRGEKELAQSNLCYYSGSFRGEAYVQKPPAFLSWAKKVLAWMRRRTPEWVPVHGSKSRTRATKRVAEACRSGLKVGL